MIVSSFAFRHLLVHSILNLLLLCSDYPFHVDQRPSGIHGHRKVPQTARPMAVQMDFATGLQSGRRVMTVMEVVENCKVGMAEMSGSAAMED